MRRSRHSSIAGISPEAYFRKYSGGHQVDPYRNDKIQRADSYDPSPIEHIVYCSSAVNKQRQQPRKKDGPKVGSPGAADFVLYKIVAHDNGEYRNGSHEARRKTDVKY
mmetsp:Transcript_9874/g.19303  ORF Transcript_9874/g.19303 Transcript_9874/m.19303 type:complete len:108 (+) Transcript_9874:634-957(+)